MQSWACGVAALTGVLGCACAADAPPAKMPAAATAAAAGLTLEGAVQAALDDAKLRSGLPPGAFELISAQDVIWSDGSLGCAQPGLVYTQALVPGYRVRLRGPTVELDYHGSRRSIILCPPDRGADPLPGASRM